MSGSYQQVIVQGNLGRDPEVRTFPNGGKVCNLRVATSETWKDRTTGEKRERTEWHSIAVYQEGGVKFLEQHACKGTKVFIVGKLETRKWQDQSGNDRYSTEIVVRPYGGQVQITGNWREGSGGGGGGGAPGGDRGGYSGGYDGGNSGGTPAGDGHQDLDDEIPF